MFWGVVTMVDAGVEAVVVFEEEVVESLVLSFVFCSLLLQDANETNKAPSNGVQRVRAVIIVVVFKY